MEYLTKGQEQKIFQEQTKSLGLDDSDKTLTTC